MSLSTALSGLLSYQRALDTTSHNISNVATEGYSRQRVDLAAREAEYIGVGYLGKGVNTIAVERTYDQFLIDQVVNRTSSYNQSAAYNDIASQLDTVLGDEDIGLTTTLDNFFNALHDVSADPTSIPARRVLLSQAETLNNRFQTIDRQIDDLRDGVNAQLDGMISEINVLSESIAEINLDIVRASGAASGAPPNDLLDQRDRLIEELAQYTNVKTSEQSDRSLNVFIGNGQALVLGGTHNTLGVLRDDYDVQDRQIAFVTNGTTIPITEQLSGGKLGGLLDVKSEVLDASQAGLGRIAIALATDFNTQHQLGDDLTGAAGGLFFTNIGTSSPLVLQNQNNNAASGNFSITIDDVNQLKASDYQLNYDGANFSLIRLSDDTVVDSGFNTGSLPRTVASEGITLSLTGTVAAGDSFLVRPTRYAAAQTGLAISDPTSIAIAATGGAVGDNSNALALAGLQTTRNMANSTATFHEAYGTMIADVGIKTNQSGIAEESQKVLLEQSEDARASVSGVNLDEEAANLIKYQQAYQAAAQLISVNDQLFRVLIGAVGG